MMSVLFSVVLREEVLGVVHPGRGLVVEGDPKDNVETWKGGVVPCVALLIAA